MKEKRESSESSSESSTEVTTTKMSPPRLLASTSPIEEVQMELEAIPNQFNTRQDADTSHYQLPNFHFCNYPDYQNSTQVMYATEPFTSDQSVYPTYYYPSLEDYYCGESYTFDNGNITSNEAQWSANNFDLNYFQ